MQLNLNAVLLDGSAPSIGDPAEQRVQHLEWPHGEAGEIVITLRRRDRSLVDLTGGQLVFTLRRLISSAAPTIARAATVTTPTSGVGAVAISSADWSTAATGLYRYDVWWVASGGQRSQVVPAGHFLLRESIARMSDVLVPPPEEEEEEGAYVPMWPNASRRYNANGPLILDADVHVFFGGTDFTVPDGTLPGQRIILRNYMDAGDVVRTFTGNIGELDGNLVNFRLLTRLGWCKLIWGVHRTVSGTVGAAGKWAIGGYHPDTSFDWGS